MNNQLAEDFINANKEKQSIHIAVCTAQNNGMKNEYCRLKTMEEQATKKRRALEFKVFTEMRSNIEQINEDWYVVSTNLYNKNCIMLFPFKKNANFNAIQKIISQKNVGAQLNDKLRDFIDVDLNAKYQKEIKRKSLEYLKKEDEEETIISIHAVKRYLQRVKKINFHFNDTIAKQYDKEILEIRKQAKKLYYQHQRTCSYFMKDNIVLCEKGNTIITMWVVDDEKDFFEKMKALGEKQSWTFSKMKEFDNKVQQNEKDIEECKNKAESIKKQISELKQKLKESELMLAEQEKKNKDLNNEKERIFANLVEAEKKVFKKENVFAEEATAST